MPKGGRVQCHIIGSSRWISLLGYPSYLFIQILPKTTMFSQNTMLDTHKTLIYNMIFSFHSWQKTAFSKQCLVVVIQTGEVWSECGLQLWGLYFESTTVFVLVKFMSHKEFMHLRQDPLHCLWSIGPLEICHCWLGHCSSQEHQMFLEISLLFLNPFALVWDQVHDQCNQLLSNIVAPLFAEAKKGGTCYYLW